MLKCPKCRQAVRTMTLSDRTVQMCLNACCEDFGIWLQVGEIRDITIKVTVKL